MSLPPVRPVPCHECPWRRVSEPGVLGPFDAETWVSMAHGEIPIACHTSIDPLYTNSQGEGSWDQDGMLQCAGAATFRKHIAKRPRDEEIAVGPEDRVKIFTWNDQFLEHHDVYPD